MKLLSEKTLMILLVLISGYGYIAGCTHDDIVPPAQANPTPIINRGEAVLLPGSMTSGDTTQWKMDKAHSSVLWSTAYVGAAGLLTGRFNQFGMHNVTDDKKIKYYTTGQPLKDSSWAFYENDPTKTYFNGYVQINTSNTGEPARDGGCNVTGLGTVPIQTGVQNLESRNLAQIKTTKVEFDPLSSDYIVTLNLTWHGYDTSAAALANPITVSVTGRLKYIKKAAITDAITGNVLYSVFGLQLTFQFNCRDFGIPSTSIADIIDIECNMNFNNK